MSKTSLRRAIQAADLDLVQSALAAGGAKAAWPAGTGALLCALFEASEATLARDAARHATLMRIAGHLLEAGAPVNTAAADGTTALHLAVVAGDEAFTARLLAAGSAADPPDAAHRVRNAPPLILAAQGGHTAIVKQLLAHGADPMRRDRNGRTGFRAALAAGHAATALPLGMGADGRPAPGALAWAAAAGALAVVEALVAAGADLNPPGQASPLERALREGHSEVAAWLAARGARRPQGTLGIIFEPGGEPRVSDVRVGSTADRIDLRRGDRIVALADIAITSVEDLQRALAGRAAGDHVRLGWQRASLHCEADADLRAAEAAPLKFDSGPPAVGTSGQ